MNHFNEFRTLIDCKILRLTLVLTYSISVRDNPKRLIIKVAFNSFLSNKDRIKGEYDCCAIIELKRKKIFNEWQTLDRFRKYNATKCSLAGYCRNHSRNTLSLLNVAENYGDARRLAGQRMMQSLHIARPSVRHLNLVCSLNFIQRGELKLYWDYFCSILFFF